MITPFVAAPLPARVERQPDEDLQSLVRRSATAMGYQQTAFILRPELSTHQIHAATLTHLTGYRDYQLLAQLLHQDIPDLIACTVHRWSRSWLSPAEQQVAEAMPLDYPFLPLNLLKHYVLPHPTGRVCPSCLAGPIPYGRVYWGLRELVTCPWHGTLLLDACPTCGAPLAMTRPDLAHCGACGIDLRTVVAVAAPAMLYSGNLWLLHRLGNHTIPLPPLPAVWQQAPWNALPHWLSLAFVQDLCQFFWKHTGVAEGHLQRRTAARGGGRYDYPDFARWCTILTYSYDLLAHWPVRIMQTLHTLDQERLFVAFSSWLLQWHQRAPAYPWLRESFADFLRQERPLVSWQPSARRWSPSPRTALKKQYFVTLPPHQPAHGEWVMDRWLAEHILGVPLATVHGLVERNILHPAGLAMTAARLIYWFRWEAIMAGVDQIMACVQAPAAARPDPCIRLCDHEPDSIAALIEAVLVHRLPLWVEEPGSRLCHVLALPAMVEATMSFVEHPPSTECTAEEVAEDLGCPVACIPTLLKRGLLRASPGRTAAPVIPRQAVLRFHTTYQFAGEAIREHGMTAGEMQEWQRYLPTLVAARLRVGDQYFLVLRRSILSAMREHWSLISLPTPKKRRRGASPEPDVSAQREDEHDHQQRIAQVQSLVKQLASEWNGTLVALPKNQYVPLLAEWRKRRKWDQTELAGRMRMRTEFIRTLENCTRRATKPTVERLAVALGVTPEQLLYR